MSCYYLFRSNFLTLPFYSVKNFLEYNATMFCQNLIIKIMIMHHNLNSMFTVTLVLLTECFKKCWLYILGLCHFLGNGNPSKAFVHRYLCITLTSMQSSSCYLVYMKIFQQKQQQFLQARGLNPWLWMWRDYPQFLMSKMTPDWNPWKISPIQFFISSFSRVCTSNIDCLGESGYNFTSTNSILKSISVTLNESWWLIFSQGYLRLNHNDWQSLRDILHY